VFSFGIYRYRIADYYPYQHQPEKIVYASVLIALLWLGSFFILRDPMLANGVFGAVVILSLAYILSTVRQESATQARQTIVIGLLCLISVMFWAFYFQMFLSLTLLLKRVAQPTLFGMPFPPPYYVAIQSLGLIIFGILLSRSKHALTLTERSIRIGNKFVLSIICMAIAYVLITIACYASDDASLISPLYFIPAYLMFALAELLLSPVGLAAITMLSSHKKVSTMMGIFFVSLGLGGFLSGKLATITAIPKDQIDTLSVAALKVHYANSLSHLLYLLLAATVICMVLNRVIKVLILKTIEEKEIG